MISTRLKAQSQHVPYDEKSESCHGDASDAYQALGGVDSHNEGKCCS